MRNDPGSHYAFGEEIPAASHAAGAVNGAGVDHAIGGAVAFFFSVGDVGGAGTLDAKIQYSDNGTDWTDDDGASGNDSAITQVSATGTAQLNVPNPRARYSRVVATVGANNVVFGCVSCAGPLRHVSPS
jgi:hypothetical protein